MTDTFLTIRMLCARYNISDRTADRWLEREELNFPQPVTINRKRYWHLEALQAWERQQAAAVARRPVAAYAGSQAPANAAPSWHVNAIAPNLITGEGS